MGKNNVYTDKYFKSSRFLEDKAKVLSLLEKIKTLVGKTYIREQLKLHHYVVEEALKQLEKEGLIRKTTTAEGKEYWTIN
jgi:Mn-dependent DtxR family transcriptional regulator